MRTNGIRLKTVPCAILFPFIAAVPLHVSAGEDMAVDNPVPFNLTAETDLKEIPPLIPVPLVIRMKNVSETVFPRTGTWEDGIRIEVYRNGQLLGNTGYGNRIYGYAVTPFKPSAELTHVFTLHSARRVGSLRVGSLFVEPGDYTIRVSCASPDLFDEAKKEGIRLKYLLQAEDVKLRVRAPADVEQGALELLQDNEAAVRMLYWERNKKGIDVLTKLVAENPGTIYADFAHFELGRAASDVKDAQGVVSRQASARARVSHFERVGKHSPLLQKYATWKKYLEMTSTPQDFQDADWNSAIREIEQLRDVAKRYGAEKRLEKKLLPIAKAMAKDGQIDPGDVP